MNEETIRLLEKAFEDGFTAGKAWGAGSGLMMRTAWIFWRELYLTDRAQTRGAGSPDRSDNSEDQLSPA